MHATAILILLTAVVIGHSEIIQQHVIADEHLTHRSWEPYIRVKRYNVVTNHAEQVMEAFRKYEADRADGKRAEHVRMKREWLATLSPEEYDNLINLHAMSIKHHPDSN